MLVGNARGDLSHDLQACTKCKKETEYILRPDLDVCQVCPRGLKCFGNATVVPVYPEWRWEQGLSADGYEHLYLSDCPSGHRLGVVGQDVDASIPDFRSEILECLPCPMGSECTLERCTKCSFCIPGYFKDAPGSNCPCFLTVRLSLQSLTVGFCCRSTRVSTVSERDVRDCRRGNRPGAVQTVSSVCLHDRRRTDQPRRVHVPRRVLPLHSNWNGRRPPLHNLPPGYVAEILSDRDLASQRCRDLAGRLWQVVFVKIPLVGCDSRTQHAAKGH